MSYMIRGFDLGDTQEEINAANAAAATGGNSSASNGLTTLISNLTQGFVQGGERAVQNLVPGMAPAPVKPPAPSFMTAVVPYIIPGLLLTGVAGAAVVTAMKKKKV